MKAEQPDEKDIIEGGEGQGPEELPFRVVDRRFWATEGEAGEEAEPLRKPTVVESLERELAQKDELLRSYIANHKEAVREFEEARVRLRREVSKEVSLGRKALLLDILEVMDNFDRAMEAFQEQGDPQAMFQGVSMVRDQLIGKLENFGIKKLDSRGLPFDPQFHEAVGMVPVTDPEQAGKVVGVIAEAYLMGDEVLRPARVVVGKMKE